MSDLTQLVKRWQAMSLVEQMGNIGSEVSRARMWHEKDANLFWASVARALELFDLTLNDDRWKQQRREILRAKEVFCDAVLGGVEFKSTLESIDDYLLQFAMLNRRNVV